MTNTQHAPSVVFNPYAAETDRDPFPIYRRLREEAPVYRNDDLGFYALSRYDDVLHALHDTETYCSRHGITLEPKSPLPMMITMDPPQHTVMRRVVSRVFTPRRIAALEPVIRSLSAKWLDRFRDDGRADLVVDYAAKLPMDVISHMLGVPDEDQDQLREWTDAMIEREDGNPDILPHGIEAGAHIYSYFTDLVRSLRTNGGGDDLTSGLLTAEADGSLMSDDEIVGFCFLLIIAGNETTTKLIGNSMYWLGHLPDQRRLVLDDPSRLPEVVEETLRYDGSTQLMARTLTRDVDLHDTTMRSGEKVLLLLGAANRDPAMFDRPDEFDLTRDTKAHVGFGHGVHVCLGAALARLEMRIALGDLLAAMPDFEIDDAGLRRINSGNVRGYDRMPITFTPVTGGSSARSGVGA